MNTLLVAATTAFLFLASFAGSAGLRVAMLLLAAIALAARFRRDVLPVLPLVPRAIAAAWAAWALLATASLAWTADFVYTRGELRAEIVYGTLASAGFFLAANDESRYSRWTKALLAGTLAAFAAQWLQEALPFSLSRHAVAERRGPWSTHLVLVAPFVLALGWPRPWGRGRGRLAQAAAIAILFGMAWHADSRIVWAAFAVQLAVAFALSSRLPELHRAGHAPRPWRAALAALLITAVAFSAAVFERNAALRPGTPLGTTLALDVRPQIWSIAWGHFERAPLLGHGFGREILAEQFAPETPREFDHPELRHAHNVFVDVALQLGLVGLAVFVVLLLALAREYRRFLADPAIAPLGILGLALIAGFLVKNTTDDFLFRHNALVFWALNGMLLGFGRRRASAPVRA